MLISHFVLLPCLVQPVAGLFDDFTVLPQHLLDLLLAPLLVPLVRAVVGNLKEADAEEERSQFFCRHDSCFLLAQIIN